MKIDDRVMKTKLRENRSELKTGIEKLANKVEYRERYLVRR